MAQSSGAQASMVPTHFFYRKMSNYRFLFSLSPPRSIFPQVTSSFSLENISGFLRSSDAGQQQQQQQQQQSTIAEDDADDETEHPNAPATESGNSKPKYFTYELLQCKESKPVSTLFRKEGRFLLFIPEKRLK